MWFSRYRADRQTNKQTNIRTDTLIAIFLTPTRGEVTSMSGRNVRWPRRMLPLVSHGEYADGTDGRTDDRPLHGRGQSNKYLKMDCTATIVLQSDSVSSSPAFEVSLLTITMLSARLMPASSRSSRLKHDVATSEITILRQDQGQWHTLRSAMATDPRTGGRLNTSVPVLLPILARYRGRSNAVKSLKS